MTDPVVIVKPHVRRVSDLGDAEIWECLTVRRVQSGSTTILYFIRTGRGEGYTPEAAFNDWKAQQ